MSRWFSCIAAVMMLVLGCPHSAIVPPDDPPDGELPKVTAVTPTGGVGLPLGALHLEATPSATTTQISSA